MIIRLTSVGVATTLDEGHEIIRGLTIVITV